MGIITGFFTMFFWGVAIFLAALASRKIGNILTLFWMQLFGFFVVTAYFLFNSNSLSLISPLGASWSLITVVLSVIFLREALKTNQLFAILLIACGILIVSVNL